MAEKKNLYTTLPDDIAGKILRNALQANAMEENKIPLESLVAYSNYRRERLFLQRVLAVLMFGIFLLIPFLFVLPKAQMTIDAGSAPGRPAYNVSVSHNRMVSGVRAMIEENKMPVYQTDDGTYSVRPTQNGMMTVTVRLYNDQYDEMYVDVTGVDMDAPELQGSEVKGGNIYLTIGDKGTGVDYDRLYAIDAAGNTIFPTTMNSESGQVTFPYPENTINLHLYDLAGNHLQLVISPKLDS